VLGVYGTGAAVTTAGTSASIATFGSLTLLASNDDCAAGAKARTSGSCVTVSVASPGNRYLVKVDGAAGAQGVLAVTFRFQINPVVLVGSRRKGARAHRAVDVEA
jgi:hypothetical protein